MAGLSQALTPVLLNHITSKVAYTLPSNVYLALCTAAVSGTSTLATMSEVTTTAYPSYARKVIPAASLAASSISGGATASNTASIDFAVCGGGGTSPVVTYYAVVDAASGTTANPIGILWYGQFTSSMTVNPGNQPSIPSSNITFDTTVSAGASNFLADKIIDLSDGKTTWTPAGALYIALVTGTPAASQIAAATDIVEANYTGYTRIQIPSASWDSATIVAGVGTTTLTSPVTFPQSTGGTSTLTGYALIDGGSTTAGSAGNILWWGTLTSQVISVNTTPYFPDNGLTLTIQ